MPTHGSLTKAGKVRSQTPKIQPQMRKSPVPRRRNRRNYEKRVLMEREKGQMSRGRGRRRRR
ncbi:MAG: 30S ribosomal protein S30e [Candidatus Bathyarchaeota archaeon]|nr:MAG: 30S ribosomal protein S30e [Candidatus Bathyarchaeota archaeon]